MTESLAFRPRALLEALVRADVEFVLIGGLAVIAWGHARATDDLDLVPDPDPANVDRLTQVLRDLDGQVMVGDRLLAPDATSAFLRSGDMTFIATSLGRVDVIQGVTHIPRFEELAEEATLASVSGIDVRICSLRHLESMKLAGGRHQDRADLESLRSAHPDFHWESG